VRHWVQSPVQKKRASEQLAFVYIFCQAFDIPCLTAIYSYWKKLADCFWVCGEAKYHSSSTWYKNLSLPSSNE
jgi:hypothetical protein